MSVISRLGRAGAALAMSALSACGASDDNSGSNEDLGSLEGGTGGGAPLASGGFIASGGFTATGGSVTESSGGQNTGSGGFSPTGGVTGSGATSSGGATTTGGMGGTGGAAPEVLPECITQSSQVILMGDSYINWLSHTFPADLYAEAGQTFRMYAIGAYSMGSGGIGFIPTQLDTAIAEDPDIKVIVLDGGGNDILVPDTAQFPQGGSCKNDLNAPNIPDCQAIVQKAIDAAAALLDDVVALGVTDVVYFFYPHVPEGTLIGGLHPNAILDYALPKVKAFCDGVESETDGQLRCHFVDMVPVFEGHTDWFAAGDIHPNTTGSKAMAEAVWQKMEEVCVGQLSSNGCCQAP